MAMGHFLGGAAEGIDSGRQRSLEARALGIKESALNAEGQRDLLAQADEHIAGTMKIVGETIKASREAGKDPNSIRKAIAPLLTDAGEIAQRVGRDPSALANQVEALLSVPMKPEGAAKPQTDLAQLEADRRAGFISDADYVAGKNKILKGTEKEPSTVEGIRQKIARGETLTPGEQTVYNDAISSDPLARLMASLAGGQPVPTNAPAPKPTGPNAKPQEFTTPQEIEAAVTAGKINIGDIVMLNGKKVRVDP